MPSAIPSPGRRGPRRPVDGPRAEALIRQAKAAQRRHAKALEAAEQARADLAHTAQEMYEAGLSVSQTAAALGVHRSEAQRLIDRARKEDGPPAHR